MNWLTSTDQGPIVLSDKPHSYLEVNLKANSGIFNPFSYQFPSERLMWMKSFGIGPILTEITLAGSQEMGSDVILGGKCIHQSLAPKSCEG